MRRLPIVKYKRNPQQVFYFTRWSAQSTIIGSLASDVTGTLYFKLDYLTNSSDLVNLFDEYIIDKVKVVFSPTITGVLPGAVFQDPGQFFTTIDMNDTTSVTLANIKQYAACRIHDPLKKNVRTMHPRSSTVVYRTGVLTGYACTPKNTWVSTSYTDVEYYGMKYVWTQQTLPTAQDINVDVLYYIKCRGLK